MWQQVAFKLLKNYAKHLGLQGVWEEDEENENEQEMVPSFAETYEALQKLRHFSMCKVAATRTMKTF
jgi:hypothetical protein